LSGLPHRAHNNTPTMQYETKTHKMHTDKHNSTLSEMCDETQSREL